MNKFFISIFGENRKSICLYLDKTIGSYTTKTETIKTCFYEQQVYNTGLLQKPVNNLDVTLLLHGIVFPWNVSLDEFSENPEYYLTEIIKKYRNKLTHIAHGFQNGSYCGALHDERKDEFIAFTSFLNTIPVYYAVFDNCLIVSNDLTLIAKITKAELKLSLGMLEYYLQGTNLAGNNAFENIKTIPQGAYLRYDNGNIEVDFYYTMPNQEVNQSFAYYVEKFAEIWEDNVNVLNTRKFNYGLGLTGGIDSRLILAAMKNKNVPLLHTGGHSNNSDYLIANEIVQKINLTNHVLEDYSNCNQLEGYAEYCSQFDNPFNNNAYFIKQKSDFRKNNNLTFDIIGLTEFLGGEYHYQDRKSILSTFKMSIPNKKHEIIDHDKLFELGLRNDVINFDSINVSSEMIQNYLYDIDITRNNIMKQLGYPKFIETFLERFRHVYKMNNLLTWSSLPTRRNCENLSPSMNIQMTEFTARIPLEYRDARRLIWRYMNLFHPEISKIILNNYTLSIKSPWVLFKTTSHFVKAFNATGGKIPYIQWYKKKDNYQSIYEMQEVNEFHRRICGKSNVVKEFISDFGKLNNIQLKRLFNIALLEKRLQLGEDKLRQYLLEEMNIVERIGT